MRIVDLHRATASAPSSGMGIEPKSDDVGLVARILGPGGASVMSTFSVMGSVGTPFDKEPILFNGASIMSLAGTGKAQWSGKVEGNRYSNISIDLLSMGSSTMSFDARATDGEV